MSPRARLFCTVERRKRIVPVRLNLETGRKVEADPFWSLEKCGEALREHHEQSSGVCESCRSGHATEANRPTERGWARIRARRRDLAREAAEHTAAVDRMLTISRCSACEQPCHASQSNDLDQCPSCAKGGAS